MNANDNKGGRTACILGPDPEGDLCNHRRTADAAKHILDGLVEALKPGADFLKAALRKSSAYHDGLTNLESRVAVMSALALMQIEVTRQISEMSYGDDDEPDINDPGYDGGAA